jgi:protein-S-isoprenylcysteine O-methyltransferase Ste14
MNANYIKIFLIIYFLLYYGGFFIYNSYVVYKRTGKNPYVLGTSKGVSSFVEKCIKMNGLFIPLVLLTYSLSEYYYKILFPISYLEIYVTDILGIILMCFGFIICLSAQITMKSSWRIGIDQNNDVELVTKGIFKYSRNPFFLGTLFSYAGFFLILPNILSFTFFILYFFLIQIQMRFEEEYLMNTIGAPYIKYFSTVRRWI